MLIAILTVKIVKIDLKDIVKIGVTEKYLREIVFLITNWLIKRNIFTILYKTSLIFKTKIVYVNCHLWQVKIKNIDIIYCQ